LKLATKISLSILGVLGLTLLSSAVALVCTWQIGQLFERTIAENLPSVRATEELEIALLEQRGSVAAYILDGGKRVWLDELRQREPAFDHWLAQARSASNAPGEEEIVANILDSNRRYESKRDEVIAIYDRGDREHAKTLLLGEVNTLHDEVFKHCEEFIVANERFVNQAMQRANTRINIGTWWVAGCTALTAILGTGLFGLFYYGVLRPLRTIVAEARLAFPTAGDVAVESPDDELRTVGNYLRKLMLDAADARSTLLHSREQLMFLSNIRSALIVAGGVAARSWTFTNGKWSSMKYGSRQLAHWP
jgi:CHASE3 domain sensor protein